MKKTTAKALYLYLCSILGMVLFAMLHRAVFVLYDLLLVVDFDTYSFGMSSGTILTLDFTTMLLILFIGGWYGIALGIEWYSMVYGPNAEKPAGLFHGFIPHHWRGKRSHSKKTFHNNTPEAEMNTTSVTVPVAESRSWSFEDLITPSQPVKKKTAVRKPVAKKVVRKTTKRIKTIA